MKLTLTVHVRDFKRTYEISVSSRAASSITQQEMIDNAFRATNPVRF